MRESAVCRRIDQISRLRQRRHAVRWQSQRCATWNALRGLDDTYLESRERGAGSAGSRRRQSHSKIRAGVIMRGAHCLKVWTKKQQVVALFSAEYATVKTASEGLVIQIVAKDLGISCGLNLHLDGLGKAKHVDMQNLWQIWLVLHEESRHDEESRHERESR